MKINNEINCIDVCRQLRSDSNSNNPAIINHLDGCDACRAYAENQNKLTHSLQQAIDIDVPEGLASRILLQQSINEKKHSGSRRNRLYATAASVLLSVGLVSGYLVLNKPVSLETVALNHVKDELRHLNDRNDVQLVKVNELLKPYNMKLNKSLGDINYAGSCTIKNSKGVHIIVQTETGPVTILLMPGEYVKNRKRVDDTVFSGAVVPIENGSFAIIGGKRES
ncbi:MAG: DUF3379 family protein, partial [Gammaproteobacteria bacterium]